MDGGFNRHSRNFKKITLKPTTAADTVIDILSPTTGLSVYTLTGTGSQTSAAAQTFTSASANALAVGRLGTTTPALKVDASAALSASGVSITAAASGSGATLAAIGGTDETLFISPKGAGVVNVTGPLNFKRQVTDTGGSFGVPIQLTEAQSGRVILVDDAAGLDFLLPAITSSNIGMTFKFVVTVSGTSNSFRVTAGAGDLLFGALPIVDFNTADKITYFAADGTDDLIMTMEGTACTQGGKKGTWVEFIATSATQWFVHGLAFGDGSLATPFS